jgi:hypothetical protein
MIFVYFHEMESSDDPHRSILSRAHLSQHLGKSVFVGSTYTALSTCTSLCIALVIRFPTDSFSNCAESTYVSSIEEMPSGFSIGIGDDMLTRFVRYVCKYREVELCQEDPRPEKEEKGVYCSLDWRGCVSIKNGISRCSSRLRETKLKLPSQ